MTASDRGAARRAATLHPELGRFWIRRSLARWPGPQDPWVDLAAGCLGRSSEARLPGSEEMVAPGLLTYLPPVPAALEADRRRLAGELLAAGTPVLQQVAPGAAPADDGVHAVVDLLGSLLAGDLAELGRVAVGAVTVWPLIAGLTDDESLCQRGCERLARAGAAVAQPVTLRVDPRERQRLLAGADEAAFGRSFHAAPADEGAFARVAAAFDLQPFWLRPSTGADRVAQSQQLAELLAFGGELSLRLGREVQGHELYRAARWVDDAAVDMRALVVEGNTSILPWLRGPALEVVTEWASAPDDAPPHGVLDGWLGEYLGGSEEVDDGDD